MVRFPAFETSSVDVHQANCQDHAGCMAKADMRQNPLALPRTLHAVRDFDGKGLTRVGASDITMRH